MPFLAVLAHLTLAGSHHHTAILGDRYWRYCTHRSHRTRLPCWRWAARDTYCPRHDTRCWPRCPKETRRA